MSDDDLPQNTNRDSNSDSDSDLPTHRLILTSFSHRRGPLHPSPTPGLLFDVRALPNPPKPIRDAYTGASKPFRAHFMASEAVHNRVADIVAAVRAHLDAAHEDGEDKGKGKDEDKDKDGDGGREVRVGVRCELGVHRSVACVEELARVRWPAEWHVEVVHRDLVQRRSERDKEKRTRRVREEMGDE
ncbi:hypothetical protein D9615_008497 [Tricholomella constricta]|uniref:RapZ C-terminal domain-containing protein n=1 Tax=Tricholomella constricta TaxID=117010 RepID=A0A8H5H3Y3_9AGAR|nr:hypothetical protein D9615_008497 [Tricholomella constricta]